ncbi:MAG: TIGR03364 family FAD-dependent oxidoreductase [Planctomycetaceae bacterium]|nr:TIGR03364 family FAD-dependent oxidoreductase [Planctomycetaceae bacterium]
MTTHYDVAVIGGGIVGLANAWMAAKRNLKVLLLERTSVAQGASVRNFGMIWPVGQPAGELHDIALRSRNYWLELSEAGAIDLETCGSLHLAHNDDEWAVLEEFASLGTFGVQLLTPAETCERSPLVNPVGLCGALWSDSEIRVHPRTASAKIAHWLTETQNVDCRFKTPVVGIDDGEVIAADGTRWSAEKILVCSGSDLQTLYPDVFATSGLKLCKLQMLKSVSQPGLPSNLPHIASGLTLRHYASFEVCPSLQQLKTRIAEQTPELDRYGIHVMASTFPQGQIILGDSHEYDEAITPFDSTEIDDLMLRELRKVICLNDWEIAERWHGIYSKHPEVPIFSATPEPNVHILVGPGGAGMTMSFGLAERAWNQTIGAT